MISGLLEGEVIVDEQSGGLTGCGGCQGRKELWPDY